MTDNPIDNPPAFACAAENGHQEGMSLRDYFAGHAITSVMSQFGYSSAKNLAKDCYNIADAMLEARKEK